MDCTDFKFKLCLATPDGRPGIWVDWNAWDWEKHPLAQFRTICANEVLIDIDVDDPMELFFTAVLLVNRLKERGVPHYVYDSGGKGYHIQIWLKCSKDPKEVDWRALRSAVVRELTEGILHRTKKGNVWHWNLDPRKWNWADNCNGSVVRAVGGKKRWCKRLIAEIQPPDQRKRITRPVFPPEFEFEFWNVPEELLVKGKKIERVEFNGTKLLAECELPVCIDSLIEEEQSGVHLTHVQRVAIVAHLWKTWKSKHPTERMNESDIQEIQKIFANDPAYDANTTYYQINNIINSLEGEPRKVPGCKFMRDNGVVDSSFCRICPDKAKKG